MTEVDQDELLLKTITKLLDKAGKDPRLTPKILREKAEQRMELSKGHLKDKREAIKLIICEWWKKNMQPLETPLSHNLKLVGL